MEEHLQSAAPIISSWELLGAALRVKSVEAFAEKGLPSLSGISQASGVFLHIKETKHSPARFFQCSMPEDKAKYIAEMSEGLWPLLSQDTTLQPHVVSLPFAGDQEPGMHLYKLHHRNELLGMLGIQFDREGQLLPAEVLTRIIGLVTQTVQNLIEHEEINRQLSHLRAYQSVSSLLSQTVDLHELLDMVLFSCMDVVSAEAASILLLTDDKKNFQFYQVVGDAQPLLSSATFPANTGIAGSVLMSRQSEIVYDVQHDPRFYGDIDSKTGFRTKNMIVLPLLAGEESVGVLEVINKCDGKKFTEQEHLLLRAIADEVAFAIRNAKVFDYVVGTYCKQRQGQMSCKGCKRPLGSWTPCVKYRESEFNNASIVESTMYHNLGNDKATGQVGAERRKAVRDKADWQALVGEPNSRIDEFSTGTVLDISLQGIRFVVPKETVLKVRNKSESLEFCVIFFLADEGKPITATCRSMWFEDTVKGMEIGAAFVDPDKKIYHALKQHLKK